VCRRGCAVGDARLNVELTGNHEYRDLRIAHPLEGQRRRFGRQRRPAYALIDVGVVERHAPVLVDGEGGIGSGSTPFALGNDAVTRDDALRRRQVHIEDVRRILAGDCGREPGTELHRITCRIA